MKWYLKDGVGLVVRCEYDAVLPPPNKPTYISIKALNEWDSKVCHALKKNSYGDCMNLSTCTTSAVLMYSCICIL